MGWKEFFSDYLSFGRRDRIAIITLVLVILLIFFLPETISVLSRSKPVQTDTSWIAAIRKLELKEPGVDLPAGKNEDFNHTVYQYDRAIEKYTVKPGGELFYFDPNTLSADGWKRLGLRYKTILTIQNYLSKGGKFWKPGDLQRIYGLFPDEFERIAPYIRIESTDIPGFTKGASPDPNNKKPYEKKSVFSNIVIDINSADTAAFISLPGIGSKLAARIVNFRDKLGGFYAVAQVGETFGLPDSTFQKIKQYLKIENTSIRKININTATTEELKVHPYIRWSIANPIVAYRNEHGPFAKVEDIKKVMAVTEEIFNKIEPYLSTE